MWGGVRTAQGARAGTQARRSRSDLVGPREPGGSGVAGRRRRELRVDWRIWTPADAAVGGLVLVLVLVPGLVVRMVLQRGGRPPGVVMVMAMMTVEVVGLVSVPVSVSVSVSVFIRHRRHCSHRCPITRRLNGGAMTTCRVGGGGGGSSGLLVIARFLIPATPIHVPISSARVCGGGRGGSAGLLAIPVEHRTYGSMSSSSSVRRIVPTSRIVGGPFPGLYDHRRRRRRR